MRRTVVLRRLTVFVGTVGLGFAGAAWGQVATTTTTTSTTSTTRTAPLPPCLPGPPEQFGLPPTSTSVPCDPRGPQLDPNEPQLPLCRDIPGGAASGQPCVTIIESVVEPPPARRPLERTG